jgi:tRNA (guanine6-N2)-methyltransferase
MAGEHTVEIEVLRGLRPFVEAELPGVDVLGGDDEAVLVSWRRPLDELLGLRTAVAAYLVRTHPVPRPKGLLGHQHLTNLIGDVALAGSLHGVDGFTSFRFGAAGAWSPVFQRLATEVASATGLAHDAVDGDLLIRVRSSGCGPRRPAGRPSCGSRPGRCRRARGGCGTSPARSTPPSRRRWSHWCRRRRGSGSST